MRNLFRKFAILLSVVMVGMLALVGCGGTDEPDNPDAPSIRLDVVETSLYIPLKMLLLLYLLALIAQSILVLTFCL